MSEPGLPPAEIDTAEFVRLCRIRTAQAAAKRKDILTWGKCLFPDKFPLPFCELHDYLVSVRGEEFTNTEAPRNHAKTTLDCFLIPLFQAVEEPQSFRHYLNVQATDEKAIAVNRTIKDEIEENLEFRAIYGDMRGPRWTDSQFVLRNGVVFTCRSAGQSIRGLHYHNFRPDYIIVDDLYNEEDINNADSTKKKTDWFWSTLYPARAQTRRSVVHVRGTAINIRDLQELLKANPNCKSKTFKAVVDWGNADGAGAVLLWPEFKTVKQWHGELFNMGSLIFHREFQNERWDEASSIIKRSWLAEWEFEPGDLKIDLHHFVTAIRLGVDPSIGEKLQSDFTGIALVWRTQYDDGKGYFYWIDGLWNERLTFDKRVEKLNDIEEQQSESASRRITDCRIEAVAGFDDFAMEAQRRTKLPVTRIKSPKDKITIRQNKSKFFEQGRVKISKRIPKVLRDELFNQLINNYPTFDDAADAVFLCLDDEGGRWKHVI